MHNIKNVITIQHPESVHHTNGMIGSWTDWALSAKGVQLAGNIADNLTKELTDKSISIYSSPLLRTVQTADIVGRRLGVVPRYTDTLKERNLGKAVGKSVQWLKDHIECEENTVYDRCFSDAESRYDVWQRLLPFCEEILLNDEENIILISHGDTLSIFNAMWLGLSIDTLNTMDLYGVSGGVSFLFQNSKGKRILKRLSDTSYLVNHRS